MTAPRLVPALRAAHVPVELERVEGVAHGHLNVCGLPEATTTIDGIAAFLAATDDPEGHGGTVPAVGALQSDMV